MLRLFGPIRRILYTAQRPFQMFTYRLRMFNPRYITSQFNHIRSPFGRIGFQFKSLTRRLGISMPGGDEDDEDAGAEEEAQTPHPSQTQKRGRKRRKPKPVEYSQVHLIHEHAGRRIVHIGPSIGNHAAMVTLSEGHRPVTLHLQRDDSPRDPQILMTVLAAEKPILLDGEAFDTKDEARPILPNSIIRIDHHIYTCELFASDITRPAMSITASWMTNAGDLFKHNEDAIGLARHDNGSMFVIADGVQGGYAGAEVSAFAVKYLMLVFKRNINHPFNWEKVFQRAIGRINAEVRYFASRAPDYTGTTLTAIMLKDWTMTAVHLGDSRLYLLRQGELRQLTTDHLAGGAALPSDFSDGPEDTPTKNPRLAKAIGKDDRVQPDIFTQTLQPGDRLLLCTDGVSDATNHAGIQDFLRVAENAFIPEELIRLANKMIAPDNASVIMLDIGRQKFGESWAPEPGDRIYTAETTHRARLQHPRAYETIYQEQPAPQIDWRLTLIALFTAIIIIVSITLFSRDQYLAQRQNQLSGEPPAIATVLPATTPDQTGGN